MNEIIIDGVDVAGCIYYEPKAQVMTCHEESITKRCNNIECYYKQLKRLEQENAELKKENETLKITREKLLGDLYITEESLKDYEEHYKRSEQEKAKYYQQTLDDEIQINELLQTLQEITKYAEGLINCNQQGDTSSIGHFLLDIITYNQKQR